MDYKMVVDGIEISANEAIGEKRGKRLISLMLHDKKSGKEILHSISLGFQMAEGKSV